MERCDGCRQRTKRGRVRLARADAVIEWGQPMRNQGRFEEPVSITLKRDEAIVLLWYLTRELWNEDERNLRASFVHPAEPHSLEALLQELIPPLMDTGAPDADEIEIAARDHLLRRFE
jgi:hypothetical protein